jgi:putative cardiolipin synthase
MKAVETYAARAEAARRLMSLVAVVLIAGGCTALQPVELVPEYALAPAESPLWSAVEEAAPEDWHVLLNDGPTALDWRLRAIDSATASIDFQTFLWHFDTVGAAVLDHVVQAADRGVRVRMLVDDTFLVHEDSVLLALAEHPNIEYRVFNPFKRRAGGFATRQLLNLAEFGRLDHRMHNKAMVVDNRVAIVGGRNIADEYFGLDESANFRDLELLLGGQIVQAVSDAFDLYWNDRWIFPIETLAHASASFVELDKVRHVAAPVSELHAEESGVRQRARWLNLVKQADTGETVLYFDQPPKDDPRNRNDAPVQVANELIDLFEGAESEVVIVSAYLIPTPHLEGAVERALDRGVRVRILTNSISSNNHLTAHSAYRNHIDTLLEAGAELHEVRIDAKDRDQYIVTPVDRKTLALHAKALVIDNDKVFVGSANLDPRSLRINTEMGLLVRSRPFNKSVRDALEGDFSAANAWRLELQDDGSIQWVADDQRLSSQPAASFMQRIEDWFFSHLPIEGEM